MAIFGDTGVGKSSLLNAVLQRRLAPTGAGRPVSPDFAYYQTLDRLVGVWDSPGFEHGSKIAPRDMLSKMVKRNQRAGNERAIDVAWFCWDASAARVTESHRDLIAVLKDAGIPVIGVLTKVHAKGSLTRQAHRDFGKWIEGAGLGLSCPEVFLSAALGDDEFGLRPHGLAELVEATIRLAPAETQPRALVALRALGSPGD